MDLAIRQVVKNHEKIGCFHPFWSVQVTYFRLLARGRRDTCEGKAFLRLPGQEEETRSAQAPRFHSLRSLQGIRKYDHFYPFYGKIADFSRAQFRKITDRVGVNIGNTATYKITCRVGVVLYYPAGHFARNPNIQDLDLGFCAYAARLKIPINTRREMPRLW